MVLILTGMITGLMRDCTRYFGCRRISAESCSIPAGEMYTEWFLKRQWPDADYADGKHRLGRSGSSAA